MDVRLKRPVREQDLSLQARVCREMMEICLSAPNCKAFVMWGFTDLHSWIPGKFPGSEAALIFDASYRPKPAYHALVEALRRP